MKWKDSDKSVPPDASVREDGYEDEGYSPWENRKAKRGLSGFATGKRLIYLIAGVLLLVVLSMVFIPGMGDQSDEQMKIQTLEAKIQKLQKRLDKYETIDEKVTRIWEQAKTFEKFKERFDRSEASMSLRMDHLAMSLDALQKKTDEAIKKAAEKKVKPAAVKKSVKQKTTAAAGSVKPQKRYHIVKAGETLYSISRMYKMSVKELISKNKIVPAGVIHKGQKLLIGP